MKKMQFNILQRNTLQSGVLRWLLPGILLSLLMVLPVTAQEEESDEEYIVGVELVADGLTSPVAMASPDDGTGRMFIVDQAGAIWIVTAEGELLPDPFLDMRGQIVPLQPDYDERGVLGLAFHPDYANNGRFFVYYTTPLRAGAPEGWDHTNVVGELSVSADDPNVADLGSLKTVLQIDQPQFNHNAGHIAFGPDGYLYVPIGDGGGGDDVGTGHTPELGNGQDLSNLHGSILRIDVNDTPGDYTIPADNPFVGEDGTADEIFAYGFRNPYHISFDRGGDNALFAADAGQEIYEEVDIVTIGGNYGWNIREGTHCFDPDNPDVAPADCASTGADGEALIDPIIEYSHDDVGVVVVGGYVYRGSALPDLEGYYIFGDYTSSSSDTPDGTLLWAEASDEGAAWEWGELQIAGMDNGRLGAYVLGLGEGPDGELYVLTSQSGPTGNTGSVWRLIPAADDSGDATDDATDEAELGNSNSNSNENDNSSDNEDEVENTNDNKDNSNDNADSSGDEVPEPVTTPES
jgi:glucose/arabinose dehydrogenase